MLGMLRLHLSAPPAGADPAGKYAYKKAHFDRMLTEDVLPETQVKHGVAVMLYAFCCFTIIDGVCTELQGIPSHVSTEKLCPALGI